MRATTEAGLRDTVGSGGASVTNTDELGLDAESVHGPLDDESVDELLIEDEILEAAGWNAADEGEPGRGICCEAQATVQRF